MTYTIQRHALNGKVMNYFNFYFGALPHGEGFQNEKLCFFCDLGLEDDMAMSLAPLRII